MIDVMIQGPYITMTKRDVAMSVITYLANTGGLQIEAIFVISRIMPKFRHSTHLLTNYSKVLESRFQNCDMIG